MSQTTRCRPKAYRTRDNRWQYKAYIIMAGSSTYKGWAHPRPVTPCSLSEWMPTSMVGIAILAHQVSANVVLLCLGSHLPQLQVADLTVRSGRFEPSSAETSLHLSRLDFLLEQVDLAAQ